MKKRTGTTNGVFKTIVREVVKEELKGTEERLEKNLELKLQATEERLDEKIDISFKKYKDEVLTGLDKVMGELETIRDEFTIHRGQHDSIKERLERLGQSRT